MRSGNEVKNSGVEIGVVDLYFHSRPPFLASSLVSVLYHRIDVAALLCHREIKHYSLCHLPDM